MAAKRRKKPKKSIEVGNAFGNRAELLRCCLARLQAMRRRQTRQLPGQIPQKRGSGQYRFRSPRSLS